MVDDAELRGGFVTASLRLPVAFREEIIAHARDEAPRECCGVISGRDGVATQFYRITNTEPGNRLYMMDDGELFRTLKEIDERDEEVLVIYHSHPETVAYPSITDVAMAFYPDSFYVICSLEHPDEPVLRSFTIRDEVIEETGIEIEATARQS